MLPYIHFVIGLIVSGGLYLFFPEISLLEAGILLASSVLIDFDHYLYYVFKIKTFNLKKAYNWFSQRKKKHKKLTKEQRKQFPTIPSIFHGVEWIILFYVSGIFIWNPLIFVSLGMFLHLVTDLTETLIYPDGFE